MASSENKRELILTRSPGRLMVSLSLPAIVGMVVIGLYTFVDAIYAGQLIGVDAMGAVSIAYPFTFINSGLAAMIGMGSASVLSRAIGARDQKSIDQVMGNLVVMNLVLSLAVTVVGVAFARPLLALTGAEGAMLDLGECYLRIIFLGSLFVNFAQSSNMIMRGEGSWPAPWASWPAAPSSTWSSRRCSSSRCAIRGWAWKEPRAPPCCRRLCWRA